MDLQLHNKVILVTGGASGIGRAIVELLAEEGALPVLIDKNRQNLDEASISLEKYTNNHLIVCQNLSNIEGCERAVSRAVSTFGKIDGLVNNAGKNEKLSLSSDPKKFQPILENNLFHYYYMAHYCLPYLKKSKGAILNISSKTAVTGQGSTSGYVASKGAQLALTREWAVELAPSEIRVNAIVPAEVSTPLYESWLQSFEDPEKEKKKIASLIPMGNRMTEPEEIANMAAFLLSSRASHITGQHMYVDGGYVHLDRAISK